MDRTTREAYELIYVEKAPLSIQQLADVIRLQDAAREIESDIAYLRHLLRKQREFLSMTDEELEKVERRLAARQRRKNGTRR